MKIFFFALFLNVIIVNAFSQTFVDSIIDKIPNGKRFSLNSFADKVQAVHPDIQITKDKNGKILFLLAFTPYPNYNDKLENPCLFQSYNGVDFEPVAPSTNPLVPTPSIKHNDDPDLIFDTENNSWLIHYLATFNPDSQNLVQLTSKDLINWTKKDLIKYKNVSTKEPFMVSPAMLNLQDNSKALFYVNNKEDRKKNTVEYLLSNNYNNWNKKDVKKIDLSQIDKKINPWHIDVFNGPDKNYYMLLCGYTKGFNWNEDFEKPQYNLILAKSNDLKKWMPSVVDINPCVNGAANNCNYIYRSSGVFTDKYLLIYFSYFDKWRFCYVGVQKIKIEDLKF